MTQRLKVASSYIIQYIIYQALRNITAPAAPMVWQQSSLIITPEWEYSFLVLVHDVTIEESRRQKSQALNRKIIETLWSFLSEMLTV